MYRQHLPARVSTRTNMPGGLSESTGLPSFPLFRFCLNFLSPGPWAFSGLRIRTTNITDQRTVLCETWATAFSIPCLTCLMPRWTMSTRVQGESCRTEPSASECGHYGHGDGAPPPKPRVRTPNIHPRRHLCPLWPFLALHLGALGQRKRLADVQLRLTRSTPNP